MEQIKNYIKKSIIDRKKHIDLSELCHIRGTDSIQCRGLLAYYLDTDVPNGHIALCCHACDNGDCSNPKHLYWGTAAENRADWKLKPDYDLIIKKMSLNNSGVRNHNYGTKPWKVINGHKESWSKAKEIYDQLILTNWNFSKYGQGSSFLCEKYGLMTGSAKRMIEMFRDGWIPELDQEWLKEFSRN